MSYLNSRKSLLALRDDQFDSIYPAEIRALSQRHWTPVVVARRAAEFLVSRPRTRVLDIGCGPGKFCMVGAVTTPGHFTGVEQRGHLGDIARSTIQKAKIRNVRIIHANVTEIDFSHYEAFYFYNPFAENLMPTDKIDASVDLSEELYQKYTFHVLKQLALAPIGTRVATYWGPFDGVLLGYQLLDAQLYDTLKFWKKVKNIVPHERPSLWNSQISMDCTKFLF